MKGLKRILLFPLAVALTGGLLFNESLDATTVDLPEMEIEAALAIEDEEAATDFGISTDPYANVLGSYLENQVDAATGIKYNIWIPENTSKNKPVIFCITGTSIWANESVAFGPHLVLKNGQVTPDAVVVIIQRKSSGVITNSYTKTALSTFINDTIVSGLEVDSDRVYYYGFSQGGIDFYTFGPLYSWTAAAFSDGYNSAMNAANYCSSLKAIMYNNSTGTPSAWNKALADASASKLELTEGESYIWNVITGSHANVNQYAVVQSEGQGYSSYSKNCSWKVNETDGLPMALNWLLQW